MARFSCRCKTPMLIGLSVLITTGLNAGSMAQSVEPLAYSEAVATAADLDPQFAESTQLAQSNLDPQQQWEIQRRRRQQQQQQQQQQQEPLTYPESPDRDTPARPNSDARRDHFQQIQRQQQQQREQTVQENRDRIQAERERQQLQRIRPQPEQASPVPPNEVERPNPNSRQEYFQQLQRQQQRQQQQTIQENRDRIQTQRERWQRQEQNPNSQPEIDRDLFEDEEREWRARHEYWKDLHYRYRYGNRYHPWYAGRYWYGDRPGYGSWPWYRDRSWYEDHIYSEQEWWWEQNRPERWEQEQRQAEQDTHSATNELEILQDTLRNLEQNAAILYPVILDDSLELVLLTPDAAPVRRSVPVSREELTQTVTEFRSALQNPRSNAIAPAQQLYQWIIEPVAAELAQAEIDTLLYAPDRQLRYVPLAALHDGQQWLVERYTINNITSGETIQFANQPQAEDLTVLAAALGDQPMTVEVGGETQVMPGIPYAAEEVNAIATLIPNTTVLVGDEFSPAAVVPQLNNYDIVHLATNALLVADQPNESFILFGNGEQVTLPELDSWNLSDVDLVVLSACDTGLGSELGNGEEILGFGYRVQQAGARAAIASLWLIDDLGTKVLMEQFYRAVLQDGGSYAAALRQAQLTMLSNQPSGDRINSRSLEGTEVDSGPSSQTTSAQFEHPYYWASFILIGDGL